MFEKISQEFFRSVIKYENKKAFIHYFYKETYTGLSVVSNGEYIMNYELSLFDNQKYVGIFESSFNAYQIAWKIFGERNE